MRQAYYSVPARYAGRRLQVRLGATTVTAIAEGTVVAVHTRSLHKYTEDLVLDHYLEVLSRKPGALAGATALASARTSGAFTATHQRYWDAARKQLGDGAGTRALIGVLLLHRSLPGGDVAVGMIAAAATPPAPTPAVTALGDQAAEAVNDGGRARSHMPGVGPNGVVILISGIDCTTLLEYRDRIDGAMRCMSPWPHGDTVDRSSRVRRDVALDVEE